MNGLMVSISCITYNHAPYIKRCLEGFLMQKCSFNFEILIHDDASTDNTAAIIKEYQAKHPDIIKPIFQTENQWSKGVRGINMRFNFPRAQGEYIALCEGDDYWADPLKLQKQVDVLERHKEINICSHPSLRLYGNDLKENGYGYWGNKELVIPIQQIIKNYSQTAPMQSIMVRNINLSELTKITANLLGGHSSLQIFCSMEGGLYYLPNYMSVYRVNSSSSVSKILFKNDKNYLERQMRNWRGLDRLNRYSNFKYDATFAESKRLRAIHAIGTGYLSTRQIVFLFFKYSLIKSFREFLKAVKKTKWKSFKKSVKQIIGYGR